MIVCTGCYAFQEDDPFIMTSCPHVYFAGNQRQFATKLVTGEHGQQVRLVLVPSFAQTGTLVLVNLNDLSVQTVAFGLPNASSKAALSKTPSNAGAQAVAGSSASSSSASSSSSGAVAMEDEDDVAPKKSKSNAGAGDSGKQSSSGKASNSGKPAQKRSNSSMDIDDDDAPTGMKTSPSKAA